MVITIQEITMVMDQVIITLDQLMETETAIIIKEIIMATLSEMPIQETLMEISMVMVMCS